MLLGGSALITAGLIGCTPRGRNVHVVILDSGVAPVGAFDRFAIAHEGAQVTDPHGTQVASLVLGVTTGPAAALPPDRVRITSINVTAGGQPELSLLIAGLRRAVELGADVVNVSLGVRHPDPDLEAAVASAHDQHLLVVASAGNVRFLAPDFPARYATALSVGAVDGQGNRYQLSPAREIDVTAPGVDLAVLGPDGSTTVQSGVSLATAVVTNRVVHDLLNGRLSRPTDFGSAEIR